MRIVLASLALLVAVFACQPAEAASCAWCAIYSGRDLGGSKSCSFNTFEQCRATVSGIGGFCQPNYYAQAQQPRRKARRMRTYY